MITDQDINIFQDNKMKIRVWGIIKARSKQIKPGILLTMPRLPNQS